VRKGSRAGARCDGISKSEVSRICQQLDGQVDAFGVGGADLSAGTGLRGLQDRVAALDGTGHG